MPYNALDINNKAIELRTQLLLEIQDMIESFEYNCATGGRYAPDEQEVIEYCRVLEMIRETVNSLNKYITDREALR